MIEEQALLMETEGAVPMEEEALMVEIHTIEAAEEVHMEIEGVVHIEGVLAIPMVEAIHSAAILSTLLPLTGVLITRLVEVIHSVVILAAICSLSIGRKSR